MLNPLGENLVFVTALGPSVEWILNCILVPFILARARPLE